MILGDGAAEKEVYASGDDGGQASRLIGYGGSEVPEKRKDVLESGLKQLKAEDSQEREVVYRRNGNYGGGLAVKKEVGGRSGRRVIVDRHDSAEMPSEGVCRMAHTLTLVKMF